MSIVAIVGRPNVGKSTLFNKFVGRRMAIVSDVPGTTRDRVSAQVTVGDKSVLLVDTGGLDLGQEDEIHIGVTEQVKMALSEASAILFLVDGKDGLTAGDEELADLLRVSEKPVSLIVNKIDNNRRAAGLDDFYRLGMGDPTPISAYHAKGLDRLTAWMDANVDEPVAEPQTGVMKVAIVGRPNVGKSMLLNALFGEERVIVSDVPGTTRDAIDTVLEYEGDRILLIDTAGVRRRGKIGQGIEKYSVLRTMQAIYRADVVLLVVDASELMTAQDMHIWGYAKDAYKGMAVVVNKWDLASELELGMETAQPYIQDRLRAGDYVPVLYTSAMYGQGVSDLMPAALKIFEERGKTVATSALNRMLTRAVTASPLPRARGRRLKLFYVTQTGSHPPTFTFFVNDPTLVHFSYQRFLENRLRDDFGFEGTPIQLRFQRRSRNE